ncbi:MAG: MMPL family transporter [Porticoccaceae bacterium]|nr:MMPL family transporter [Porticoccaceae bacterium]
MSERLLHAYERIVLLHPKRVLLLVLLVTVALALGLPNFKLDASADSLTLENDSDLDYFREINERYGSGDFLVVTYSPLPGDDLFSDLSLATLTELTADLQKIDDVVNVLSMINVPLLYSPKVPVSQLQDTPRTLLTKGVDREMAKREFLNSPVFRKLILGPEGQTTALLAAIEVDKRYIELVRGRDALRYKRKSEGLSEAESLQLATVSQEFLDYRTQRAQVEKDRVKAVRALMDNYRGRAQIFLGGPSMITADMVDFIRSDLEVFGVGITLFIVLTLSVIFRQLRWVVLPLATCAFAIVMMLGWLSWIDWRLTIISSNFVALLLVLTMALTIHLIVRYRELHHDKPEASQLELVREMVNFMARPCIYTVLTTIVAFASLVVSGIRPVIDFGWMMTIGLSVSLVLGFLVIPAGMLVLGKARVVQRGSQGGQLPAHFSNFTERHGNLVLLLSLVVSVISVLGITKLQVDNRFIDYFKEHTEIYQGLSIIDQKLGGTTPLDIIIQAPASAAIPLTLGVPEGDDPFGEEDPFESDPFADDPFGDDVFGEEDPNQQKPSYWFSRSGLEELEQITTYLDDMDEIGRIDSLVTAFHVANDLTGHRMNDFELAVMRKGLSPEMNSFLLAPYLNDATDEARLTMRTVESGATLNRQQLLEEINSFLIDEVGLAPEQFRLSGLMVLYNNMLQSLFHSQIVTLGAVFLGIMLMFVVLFRSLLIAFIAIFPNILAACVVLGVMGWAGIPLDMMTITIASITVGIGVDDTLHYIYRFREEFAKDRDYVASMHRSHKSIGVAMYYTSIVIIVGFSILALSNFMPSVYFGFLTGLAMLTALLASQTLLPKLILLTRPLGK